MDKINEANVFWHWTQDTRYHKNVIPERRVIPGKCPLVALPVLQRKFLVVQRAGTQRVHGSFPDLGRQRRSEFGAVKVAGIYGGRTWRRGGYLGFGGHVWVKSLTEFPVSPLSRARLHIYWVMPHETYKKIAVIWLPNTNLVKLTQWDGFQDDYKVGRFTFSWHQTRFTAKS